MNYHRSGRDVENKTHHSSFPTSCQEIILTGALRAAMHLRAMQFGGRSDAAWGYCCEAPCHVEALSVPTVNQFPSATSLWQHNHGLSGLTLSLQVNDKHVTTSEQSPEVPSVSLDTFRIHRYSQRNSTYQLTSFTILLNAQYLECL